MRLDDEAFRVEFLRELGWKDADELRRACDEALQRLRRSDAAVLVEGEEESNEPE